MELRKATKSKSKLRIGLAGTSGSGKTYSALLMASGMTAWDKICVIDTENGSADLYDSLGAYNVITLTAPFTPERYIEAIKTAETAGMEVIIIDSITHEWDGKGGCLEIVESLGGRYQDWGKVTPRHAAFVQALLQSPAHIITTVRRKQDYEMTKDQNGKLKVEKAGLKEITREGFEYELTTSFNINQRHLAEASKDRTGIFMDKPEFVITADTGKSFKDWAEKGIEPVKVPVEAPKPAQPTASSVPMITPFQIKKIVVLLKEKGYSDEQLKAKYQVASKKDLTLRQASEIIENLMKLPNVETVNPDEIPENLGANV